MIRRISGPRAAYTCSNIELILFITITWIFSLSLILILSDDNEQEQSESISRRGQINTTENEKIPTKIYDNIINITTSFISANEELKQQPHDEEKQKFFAKPKKIFTMDKAYAVKQSFIESSRYCYMFIKELLTLMKNITVDFFIAVFNISYNIIRFALNLISLAFYWTKRISISAYECIVSFIHLLSKIFSAVCGFIEEICIQCFSLIQRNFMKPYYFMKSMPSLCTRFLDKLCVILVNFIREIIPK